MSATPGQAADALRRALEARIELWRQVGEATEDLDGLPANAREATVICAHELAEDLRTWQEQAAAREPYAASSDVLRRIRSVLQDAPTASIARREALEIVNALDLDGVLKPEPQPAPVDIDEHRHYTVVRVGGRFAAAAVHHSLDGLVIYTSEAEFNDAKARDFE